MDIDIRIDQTTGDSVAYRDGTCLGPVVVGGDAEGPGRAEEVRSIIGGIYAHVARLEELYPGIHFTPDGHMVGSLGEAIASERYGITLFRSSHPVHDGIAPDGRLVQVKATQGDKIGISAEPEHLIVLKMGRDGTFEEVYNGLGSRVWSSVGKATKTSQRQISLSRLRALDLEANSDERIPLCELDS